MTAARRRLLVMGGRRRSIGVVKTLEVPSGFPYTDASAAVRAGVVGAVR